MENRVFTLKAKISGATSITEHGHISQLISQGFTIIKMSTTLSPGDNYDDIYITVVMTK